MSACNMATQINISRNDLGKSNLQIRVVCARIQKLVFVDDQVEVTLRCKMAEMCRNVIERS